MGDKPAGQRRGLTFADWQREANVRLTARQAERQAEKEATLAARTPHEVEMDEWVKRQVDAAPPLSPQQVETLRRLVAGVRDRNPMPGKQPTCPKLTGRALDPQAGTLYARHLRASDGACGRCGTIGPREVDHCHAHEIVRGLICKGCNGTPEDKMGRRYRENCSWCEWDMWLARELEI